MTDLLEEELRTTLRAVAETCSPPAGGPPDVPEIRGGRARVWLAVAAAAVLVVAILVPLLATSDERQQGPVEVGPTSVPPSTSLPPTSASLPSSTSVPADEPLPPPTSSVPADPALPLAEGWSWSTGAEAPIRASASQFSVWTGTEMLVWSIPDGDYVGAAYDPGSGSWRELGIAEYGGGVPRGVAWLDGRAVFYVEELVVGGSLPGWGVLRSFDPATGEWETLLPLYDLPAGRFADMHVIDGEVVVEMITGDGSPGILDDVGQVTRVDPSFFPTDGSDAAFATLEPTYEIVTVEPVDIGEEIVVGRGDPATGETTWLLVSAAGASALPDAPDPAWWSGATAVWTGEQVIVWGGWACPPADGCLLDNGPTRPLVLTRTSMQPSDPVVVVPTVVDLFADTAEASLHNQGLEVEIVLRAVPVGSESVGRVLEQDPSAFTEVEPGTTITIVVGEPAQAE